MQGKYWAVIGPDLHQPHLSFVINQGSKNLTNGIIHTIYKFEPVLKKTKNPVQSYHYMLQIRLGQPENQLYKTALHITL